MTLVSMKSIEDLNMGNSIVAEGSTGGVKKYWQGRMRYKIDNGGWKSETTGTMLYSADGTYLGLQKFGDAIIYLSHLFIFEKFSM